MAPLVSPCSFSTVPQRKKGSGIHDLQIAKNPQEILGITDTSECVLEAFLEFIHYMLRGIALDVDVGVGMRTNK